MYLSDLPTLLAVSERFNTDKNDVQTPKNMHETVKNVHGTNNGKLSRHGHVAKLKYQL